MRRIRFDLDSISSCLKPKGYTDNANDDDDTDDHDGHDDNGRKTDDMMLMMVTAAIPDQWLQMLDATGHNLQQYRQGTFRSQHLAIFGPSGIASSCRLAPSSPISTPFCTLVLRRLKADFTHPSPLAPAPLAHRPLDQTTTSTNLLLHPAAPQRKARRNARSYE